MAGMITVAPGIAVSRPLMEFASHPSLTYNARHAAVMLPILVSRVEEPRCRQRPDVRDDEIKNWLR